MKIDIYCHIFGKKYRDILYKHLPPAYIKSNRNLQGNERLQALWDMDFRERVLEPYDDYVQVLTVNMPAPDIIPDPKAAAEAARVCNDEMAEILAKNPKRFIAGVASLSLHDIPAALDEIDRSIKQLGLKGIRLDSNIQGKPLDLPEFMPIYEKMAAYDLPIWIHPVREYNFPDYLTETESKYGIATLIGWPYDMTAAMIRLVCSGVLEKYPNLKIITHHCGGFVPYIRDRIIHMWDLAEKRGLPEADFIKNLSRCPIDYFRMFYNDIIMSGGPLSLMVGHQFFGTDHLLFGTDAPFDVEFGRVRINEVIKNLEESGLPAADKKKIYETNAIKLLKLEDEPNCMIPRI